MAKEHAHPKEAPKNTNNQKKKREAPKNTNNQKKKRE
jgi:hypothetical protein